MSKQASAKADFRDSFGKRLQEAREDARLTQAQAAEQIGCVVSSLGNWEAGTVNPRLREIVDLAELYGVSLDWLVGRPPDIEPLQPGSFLVDRVLVNKVLAAETEEELSPLLDWIASPLLTWAVIPEGYEVLEAKDVLKLQDEIQGVLDSRFQPLMQRWTKTKKRARR